MTSMLCGSMKLSAIYFVKLYFIISLLRIAVKHVSNKLCSYVGNKLSLSTLNLCMVVEPESVNECVYMCVKRR